MSDPTDQDQTSAPADKPKKSRRSISAMKTARVHMVRVTDEDMPPAAPQPATIVETRFDLAAIGALAEKRGAPAEPIDAERATVPLAPVRIPPPPDPVKSN